MSPFVSVPPAEIPNVSWINVRDYATFQEAIDAVPAEGGVVYIPPGTYSPSTVPAVVPMTITSKSVSLVGDGVNCTHLILNSLSATLITINSSDFVQISGIRFQGGGGSGGGRGVVFNTSSYSHIKDCWFDQFPSWAIDFATSSADCVGNIFTNVRVSGSKSNGAVRLGIAGAGASKAFSTKFHDCIITCDVAGARVVDVSWAQKATFTGGGIESTANVNHIYSQGLTIGLTIDNVWFETNNTTVDHEWFIQAVTGFQPGWAINDCHFVRTGTGIAKSRIFKSTGGTRQLNIRNYVAQVHTAPVAGDNDDIVLVGGDTAFLQGGLLATIGFGTLYTPRISAADPASVIKLGFDQRLKAYALPLANFPTLDINDGDILYDATNNRLKVYAGGGWRELNTAP